MLGHPGEECKTSERASVTASGTSESGKAARSAGVGRRTQLPTVLLACGSRLHAYHARMLMTARWSRFFLCVLSQGFQGKERLLAVCGYSVPWWYCKSNSRYIGSLCHACNQQRFSKSTSNKYLEVLNAPEKPWIIVEVSAVFFLGTNQVITSSNAG